ncbi:MAG: VCBS repeat-containing protein, partial [Planctomycetes bacterium]|nr:VCBS repeat-containing protein [Planctomycetota bacterium]
DLDLFIGGRVIPGKYPLAPSSRLLRNDDGKLVDVTQQLAPALLKTGLVTGALWSDADGDGRVDLLVTHEWGPVKLFRNDGGRLVDATKQAGLADRLGWWNGITGRDLDGDGDVDYVVTNLGLNTKYHASKNKPALLYYGDFDGKGTMRLVEAEFEDNKLFPVRGKSCSIHAIPHLGNKFSTFKGFAIAELPEIYTPKCLIEAHRYAADTLESGLLINDGKGRFSFVALPRIAQIAPAFGVVLTEVNGDGVADLYLVNNFFGPQPETGRMDGGLSLLLLGNGDGSFDPVWPDGSGLIVPGDSKSLAATDLNGDGWPDFVVGVNDDVLSVFQHNGRSDGRVVAVHLEGPKGNPSAVGARVTAHLSDGSTQTAEIYAGSGYLSQSTATLTFGLGASRHLKRLAIIWPDGRKSEATEALGQSPIRVKYPD